MFREREREAQPEVIRLPLYALLREIEKRSEEQREGKKEREREKRS